MTNEELMALQVAVQQEMYGRLVNQNVMTNGNAPTK